MLSKVCNPYLDEYLETLGTILPTHGEMHLHLCGTLLNTNSWRRRDECLQKYSFAVPNDEAIATLVKYSPVVEIGCGLGYWAKLVHDAGGEIIPHDIHVNKKGMVKLYMSKDEYATPHTQVFKAGVEAAELHSDKALFLCWPPYNESMAHDCLQTYLKYGGQTLIYIGENYGCTGDDAFHDLIENNMELSHSVQIPVWPGIHDCMYVYTVKK